MTISRREFVENIAVSAGAACLLGPHAICVADSQAPSHGGSVVLDLGAGCVLPESLHGYRAALGVPTTRAAPDVSAWLSRRLAIIPAAGLLDSTTVSALVEILRTGSTVLLESGGGFLSAEEFAEHRRTLRDGFRLSVEGPVDLWLAAGPAPYVEYSWPQKTLVRDFSRAIPVSVEGTNVIARFGTLPVAAKKRVGNGSLIFLGSPLGPALRAGDDEALAWLRSLVEVDKRS